MYFRFVIDLFFYRSWRLATLTGFLGDSCLISSKAHSNATSALPRIPKTHEGSTISLGPDHRQSDMSIQWRSTSSFAHFPNTEHARVAQVLGRDVSRASLIYTGIETLNAPSRSALSGGSFSQPAGCVSTEDMPREGLLGTHKLCRLLGWAVRHVEAYTMLVGLRPQLA